MLQTIIDVSKHHPSVYAVVMISLIVQTAFSVFYSFAAIAVYVTWTPGNPCKCDVLAERKEWRLTIDSSSHHRFQLVRPTRARAERSPG